MTGAACGDSNDAECTNPDTCDGAGTCLSNDLADDTPRADGDLCTAGSTCQGLQCIGGGEVVCDDADPSTVDTCDPATGECVFVVEPDPTCRAAELSALSIVNSASDSRDKLRWKWLKGIEETNLEDFGIPDDLEAGTTYDLLIYDGVGAPNYELVARMHIPASENWRGKSSGWKYRDRDGTADGILGIKLRPGTPGRSRIGLKAGGENLPTPVPISPSVYFSVDPSVTVQLSNSLGFCWVSEFTDEPFKNTGSKFKTKRKVLVP